jgi:hypothetical protein
MNLTKGKISKIRNKKRQSLKKYKKDGKKSKSKTFRKRKPLNLHNSSLKKYKGGQVETSTEAKPTEVVDEKTKKSPTKKNANTNTNTNTNTKSVNEPEHVAEPEHDKNETEHHAEPGPKIETKPISSTEVQQRDAPIKPDKVVTGDEDEDEDEDEELGKNPSLDDSKNNKIVEPESKNKDEAQNEVQGEGQKESEPVEEEKINQEEVETTNEEQTTASAPPLENDSVTEPEEKQTITTALPLENENESVTGPLAEPIAEPVSEEKQTITNNEPIEATAIPNETTTTTTPLESNPSIIVESLDKLAEYLSDKIAKKMEILSSKNVTGPDSENNEKKDAFNAVAESASTLAES